MLQALEEYTARQLRLLFVLSQWDKPMNYGENVMLDVVSKERDLRTFFQNVQVALREVPPPAEADQRWGADEKEMQTSVEEAEDEVRGEFKHRTVFAPVRVGRSTVTQTDNGPRSGFFGSGQ